MKPFLGVDLIFCVEPHISKDLLDIKLDNLEPAPVCPDPELEVKALKEVKLDILEQALGCSNEQRSTQKIMSLPLKMASQIPKTA